MRDYEITPAADHDLDEIALFIAKDNVDAAIRVLDAARAAFELLAQFPESGALRAFPQFNVAPARAWPLRGYENYVIYYRQTENGILIVRVLHGAQNAGAELAAE